MSGGSVARSGVRAAASARSGWACSSRQSGAGGPNDWRGVTRRGCPVELKAAAVEVAGLAEEVGQRRGGGGPGRGAIVPLAPDVAAAATRLGLRLAGQVPQVAAFAQVCVERLTCLPALANRGAPRLRPRRPPGLVAAVRKLAAER